MRNLSSLFRDKQIDYEKLLNYGFTQYENSFVYKRNICADTFVVIIQFSKEQKTSKVIDLSTNEEYILADIVGAVGNFVGNVRKEYDSILQDIVLHCTTVDIFKANQSKIIIEYAQHKYKDSLEFLWQRFPKDAILRNKQNNLWYAVFLVIPKNRLGIDSAELVEIIDLRYQKEKINDIIDNKVIYPGYHMNKNNWLTIKLDNSLPTDKILELLDNSYQLSLSKK